MMAFMVRLFLRRLINFSFGCFVGGVVLAHHLFALAAHFLNIHIIGHQLVKAD